MTKVYHYFRYFRKSNRTIFILTLRTKVKNSPASRGALQIYSSMWWIKKYAGEFYIGLPLYYQGVQVLDAKSIVLFSTTKSWKYFMQRMNNVQNFIFSWCDEYSYKLHLKKIIRYIKLAKK